MLRNIQHNHFWPYIRLMWLLTLLLDIVLIEWADYSLHCVIGIKFNTLKFRINRPVQNVNIFKFTPTCYHNYQEFSTTLILKIALSKKLIRLHFQANTMQFIRCTSASILYKRIPFINSMTFWSKNKHDCHSLLLWNWQENSIPFTTI